jgi:hypothetical protein
MVLPVARPASKFQAIPIGFLCVSTNWTRLTRMSRTNKLNSNAFCSSLVADVKLALSKRPAMISRSLFVMSRFLATTNPCQVFHHNASGSNRFGKGYQLLTCSVEELLRYGLLTSTKSFQKTFRGRSANAGNLRFCLSQTETTIVKNTSRDIQSFVGLFVSGGQDVLDSTINANNGSSRFNFWNVDFDGQAKIPMLARIFKFTVAPLSLRYFSALKSNWFTPNGQRRFSSNREVTTPADGDDKFFEDSKFPLLVGLHCSVGSDNVPEKAARYLARKIEFLTNNCVILPRELCWGRWFTEVEYDRRKPVCCVSVCSSDFGEPCGSRGQFEFDSPDCFHTNTYLVSTGRNSFFNYKNYFPLTKGNDSSPILKDCFAAFRVRNVGVSSLHF